MPNNLKKEKSSNSFFRLSFKQVLVLLVVIPIIPILYFSVTIIRDEIATLNQLLPLEEVSELSLRVGSYIHEMQKERGLTGGFMGSDGREFMDVLREQRQLTDEKRKDLDSFLETFNPKDFEEEFSRVFDIAFSEYNKLDDVRGKISKLSISDNEGIAFYTQHNSKMLDVIRLISAQTSPDVELTEGINAYIIFLEGKDKAGEERAIMTNTFAADKFGDGAFDRFIFLIHSQDIYFEAFMWYASQEQINFFLEKKDDPIVAEVQKMRDIAYSKTEDFSVDSLRWFLSMTAKIESMQEVSDRILSDVINKAVDLENQSKNKLQYAILSMVGTLLAVLFLGIYLAYSLSRRINDLRKGVDIIKGGDFNHKVGTNDKDEIGELSRAFDEMTTTISESQMEVDRRVKQQTESIMKKKKEVDSQMSRAEAISDSMVGRELKMIELKKEIAGLKQKISITKHK